MKRLILPALLLLATCRVAAPVVVDRRQRAEAPHRRHSQRERRTSFGSRSITAPPGPRRSSTSRSSGRVRCNENNRNDQINIVQDFINGARRRHLLAPIDKVGARRRRCSKPRSRAFRRSSSTAASTTRRASSATWRPTTNREAGSPHRRSPRRWAKRETSSCCATTSAAKARTFAKKAFSPS